MKLRRLSVSVMFAGIAFLAVPALAQTYYLRPVKTPLPGQTQSQAPDQAQDQTQSYETPPARIYVPPSNTQPQTQPQQLQPQPQQIPSGQAVAVRPTFPPEPVCTDEEKQTIDAIFQDQAQIQKLARAGSQWAEIQQLSAKMRDPAYVKKSTKAYSHCGAYLTLLYKTK